MRIEAQAIRAELQSCEAKNRYLPQATLGADVDSQGRVAHGVVEVDGRGLVEVLLCKADVAKPRRHDGVGHRAQRAAVAGTGLIETEIRLARLG